MLNFQASRSLEQTNPPLIKAALQRSQLIPGQTFSPRYSSSPQVFVESSGKHILFIRPSRIRGLAAVPEILALSLVCNILPFPSIFPSLFLALLSPHLLPHKEKGKRKTMRLQFTEAIYRPAGKFRLSQFILYWSVAYSWILQVVINIHNCGLNCGSLFWVKYGIPTHLKYFNSNWEVITEAVLGWKCYVVAVVTALHTDAALSWCAGSVAELKRKEGRRKNNRVNMKDRTVSLKDASN